MIIPVGYGQINLFFTGSAAPRGAQITFGIENVLAGTAADVAAVVGTTWASDVNPDLATTITFSGCKCKLGPNDTGDEALIPFAVAGTASSQNYSPQVAGLVTKLTSLGGRKGRGRLFVPGLTEGDTDGDGKFNSGTLGDWQTKFDTFLDDLTSADTPMVLLHNDATAPTTVTALVVNQLFASQRRRIRKVGGRRTPTP